MHISYNIYTYYNIYIPIMFGLQWHGITIPKLKNPSNFDHGMCNLRSLSFFRNAID